LKSCILLVLISLSPIQAQESGTHLIPFILKNTSILGEKPKIENSILFYPQLKSVNKSHKFGLNDFKLLTDFDIIRLNIQNNPLQQEDPPKMNIANAIFRFVLELGALGAMGWWGYDQIDGIGRYALMVGVPLVAAAAWGTFTVPSDPSRGQNGPVPVSGIIRLLVEGTFFGFASWALHDLDKDIYVVGFGSAVILHYALSLERSKWLIRQ